MKKVRKFLIFISKFSYIRIFPPQHHQRLDSLFIILAVVNIEVNLSQIFQQVPAKRDVPGHGRCWRQTENLGLRVVRLHFHQNVLVFFKTARVWDGNVKRLGNPFSCHDFAVKIFVHKGDQFLKSYSLHISYISYKIPAKFTSKS